MPSQYRLRPNPRLREDLRLVPPRIKADIIAIIDDLVHDPYPPDAEELRDHYSGVYKIKVDGWRIFYTVNETNKKIFVAGVKRRTPDTYISIFGNYSGLVKKPGFCWLNSVALQVKNLVSG